jgi:hypothetical protein
MYVNISPCLADRRYLNHHLTGVSTSVEVNETLRRRLQSTRHDMLLALELTLGQPRAELLEGEVAPVSEALAAKAKL